MILIEKSNIDTREIFGGKLSNNIKYIIINDPNIFNSSYISISVKCGSYNDPDDYNGLAHFLEHMLFMGSSKYPGENYFMNKLNNYGGSMNAVTEDYFTTYYFNVFNEHLEEMIDIFSRFFIDPLFNINSINKEINAVNNEHLKNIHNDMWILDYFINFITDKNSNINKFGTGSLDTLNKPDIRNVMIQLYNKYYTICENISICISSSLSINNIYDIINKIFSQIKNNNKEELIINKPLFKNINKIYHLISNKNIYDLIFLWEIPKVKYHNIFNLLVDLLYINTKNSFYFYLINKGYITNLSINIKDEGIFIIYFSLTENGIKYINEIENILFIYLDTLYTNNLNLYAEYYKNIDIINFDNILDIDYTTLSNVLAKNHLIFDTKTVLKNSFINDIVLSSNEYILLYKKYINKNFTKIIHSNKLFKDYNYLILPHYITKYVELDINTINTNIIEKKINLMLFNIDLNFINNNNNVIIKNLDKNDIPIRIKNNIWYYGLSKFNEPIVIIWIQLINKNLFNTPKNFILTQMAVLIINHLLNTILYNIFLIENYNISIKSNNITSSLNIYIKSFNNINKINLLINEFKNFIKNIQDNFNIISEKYINSLLFKLKENFKNIKYNNPWEYNNYIFNLKSINYFYNNKILLETIESITYYDIKNYIYSIFNNNYNILIFIFGNIHINNIEHIIEHLNIFNNISFKLNNNLKILTNNIIIKHPNKKEKSNCVTFYYKIGNFTPYNYLLIQLILLILNNLFFNELRTKHQLGYLVSMNYIHINNYYYIYQKVQSNKDTNTIKKKINEFNKNIINIINDTNIDVSINSIRNNLLSNETNTIDLFLKYEYEIKFQYYLFNRDELLLNKLNFITKDDIITFVKKYINKQNKIKLIIKGN